MGDLKEIKQLGRKRRQQQRPWAQHSASYMQVLSKHVSELINQSTIAGVPLDKKGTEAMDRHGGPCSSCRTGASPWTPLERHSLGKKLYSGTHSCPTYSPDPQMAKDSKVIHNVLQKCSKFSRI